MNILNIDHAVGSIFINSGIFKNVHPNTISIIGICLNFVLLWCILQKISIHIVSILLICRCLTDILDGMVARKYDKKSNLGGWLDTIQDMLLVFFVLPFILLYKYTKNKLLSLVIPSILIIISLVVCYNNDDLWDHDNIDNEFFQIYRNNTVLLFILAIVLNYKFKLLYLA